MLLSPCFLCVCDGSLSTVLNVDRVVVLEHGAIVEMGSLTELRSRRTLHSVGVMSFSECFPRVDGTLCLLFSNLVPGIPCALVKLTE